MRWWNMFVSSIYLSELQWRLTYILISFSFTVCTVFYFVDIFLFLEIYPFTKSVNKILMATYITELFYSVVNVCCTIANIFLFPLISFHVQSFLAPSMYFYQLRFLRKVTFFIFMVWIFIFLTCYNILLPQFFDFFTQWEVTNKKTIFQLHLNATIKFYLDWVNTTYNSFSCTVLIFSTFSLLIFFYCQINTLYSIFKHHRNLISFCLTCLLYLFLPPDFILQVFFILFSFFISDIIFFFLCFKIQQRNFPDSSIG